MVRASFLHLHRLADLVEPSLRNLSRFRSHDSRDFLIILKSSPTLRAWHGVLELLRTFPDLHFIVLVLGTLKHRLLVHFTRLVVVKASSLVVVNIDVKVFAAPSLLGTLRLQTHVSEFVSLVLQNRRLSLRLVHSFQGFLDVVSSLIHIPFSLRLLVSQLRDVALHGALLSQGGVERAFQVGSLLARPAESALFDGDLILIGLFDLFSHVLGSSSVEDDLLSLGFLGDGLVNEVLGPLVVPSVLVEQMQFTSLAGLIIGLLLLLWVVQLTAFVGQLPLRDVQVLFSRHNTLEVLFDHVLAVHAVAAEVEELVMQEERSIGLLFRIEIGALSVLDVPVSVSDHVELQVRLDVLVPGLNETRRQSEVQSPERQFDPLEHVITFVSSLQKEKLLLLGPTLQIKSS